MEQVRLPDPDLAVDGRPLACSTRLVYAGAYQLTLLTTVPELAVELHSSYLGHPDGDTAVAHLQLAPGESPATLSELQPGRALPLREARRLCLYDHLAALRQLVVTSRTARSPSRSPTARSSSSTSPSSGADAARREKARRGPTGPDGAPHSF